MRLQAEGFCFFDISVFVLLEFLYRCLIHSRIFSKDCNGLFLTIVRLLRARPLRPWIGLCSLFEGFGIISSCVTGFGPSVGIAVPTQSFPVSPPPITSTCFPFAGIKVPSFRSNPGDSLLPKTGNPQQNASNIFTVSSRHLDISQFRCSIG